MVPYKANFNDIEAVHAIAKHRVVFKLKNPSAVILHNLSGLFGGYWLPRLLGWDERTCRTLAIEVGMQNSGLGVALAVKYFSAAAALPGALWPARAAMGIILYRFQGNTGGSTARSVCLRLKHQ